MFLTTTIYSIFAYVWLFIVLVVWTPDEVTVWEALITLLAFPLLVVNAYLINLPRVKEFFPKCGADAETDEEEQDEEKDAKETLALYADQTVDGKSVLMFYKVNILRVKRVYNSIKFKDAYNFCNT